MSTNSLPTRHLRAQPDLHQLKRQAKELLEKFRAGDRHAVAEVQSHYRSADPASFALHDAQLVIARAYGFDSWPKLKAYVDGVTVAALVAAVHAGDLSKVIAMLDARPELVNMDLAENDERRPLHVAVLDRSPDMVRVLMQRGADARKGVYPHRAATSALTIAVERGYDDIVAIIRELDARGVPARGETTGRSASVPMADADTLAAIRRGDVEWLRARLMSGSLRNEIGSSGGLLSAAVEYDRPEILALLLDLGFDPDERTRLDNVEDVVYSAGFPLWHCAALGRDAMAEMLLARGADPNVHVYASGSPVYSAYRHHQRPMIDLLLRHGGIVGPDIAGLYRDRERAKRLLEDAARTSRADGQTARVAGELLDFGSCGGDPEIVSMALERIDWPRGDPRWFWMLGRSLDSDEEGGTHIECFRRVLHRSGPAVVGRFGRTMLHEVAALGQSVAPNQALGFAALLLDAGARLDTRDELLKSTPLGWACRWGRREIVQLLLARGADPIEQDAEPWATPRAWARKREHREIVEMLPPGRSV